uniref:Uncharacterized protein n=1 Tax=Rhizophora mucronata TaxID=61149 RepID=A0A2P2PIV4_RHIMU
MVDFFNIVFSQGIDIVTFLQSHNSSVYLVKETNKT